MTIEWSSVQILKYKQHNMKEAVIEKISFRVAAEEEAGRIFAMSSRGGILIVGLWQISEDWSVRSKNQGAVLRCRRSL